MTAASFFSLLLPALDLCKESGYNRLACLPVTFGFLLGALFVYLTDKFMPDDYLDEMIKSTTSGRPKLSDSSSNHNHFIIDTTTNETEATATAAVNNQIRNRQMNSLNYKEIESNPKLENEKLANNIEKNDQFRKIILLIIAVTVHNIPGLCFVEMFEQMLNLKFFNILIEGLAVGVGFGA